MKNKKGIVWQELVPWIIAVGVLVVVFGLYFGLSDKGQAAIAYVQNINPYA